MTERDILSLVQRQMLQAEQEMRHLLDQALYRSEPELFRSFRRPPSRLRRTCWRVQAYLQTLGLALIGHDFDADREGWD